jgi:hypothetical protein
MVKQIDENELKKISRPAKKDADRPRVRPMVWPGEEDGSKTIPPGRSNRSKGEWMKR